MAFDFNYENTTIQSSGGFKPSKKNAPVDTRTVVDTYADIASIPNPYIGLTVTVKSDETNEGKMTDYKVISLKANALGAANMLVDEVKRMNEYLEVSSNGNVDLSDYVTEDELNTSLSTKVDKVSGYSLVSDTEIARLANVDNYDDSEIRGLIPTKVSQLENDSDYLKSTDTIDADSLNGKKISEPMTKEEYDAIVDKDANTIYLVDDDTVEEEYSLQLVGSTIKLLKGNKTISSIILPTASSGGSEIVNGEIVISEENISIKKGNSKSINISLASAPTNSQIVNINCDNSNIIINPSQLTFDSSNYSEQQAVTISVNSAITESSSIITVSSENVSSKNISLQITEVPPITGDNITSVTDGLIHSYDFSRGTDNQTTLNDLTGNCNIKLINFTFETGETQNCGWNDDGSLSTNNSNTAYASIDTTSEEYNLDNHDFTMAFKAQINGSCYILSSSSNKVADPETGMCSINYAKYRSFGIKTGNVNTPAINSSLPHRVPYGTTDVFVATYSASTRTVTMRNSTEVLGETVLDEGVEVKTMKYIFSGNYHAEFRTDTNKIYKLAIYNKCLSNEEISTVILDLA